MRNHNINCEARRWRRPSAHQQEASITGGNQLCDRAQAQSVSLRHGACTARIKAPIHDEKTLEIVRACDTVVSISAINEVLINTKCFGRNVIHSTLDYQPRNERIINVQLISSVEINSRAERIVHTEYSGFEGINFSVRIDESQLRVVDSKGRRGTICCKIAS